jgi:undecaprenyl-diphosphatase
MFSAIFTRKNKLSDTYFWHLIIGTLPVVILGFFALDFVKEFNSKTVIGVFCAFFGGALFLFDKLSRARMSSSDKKRISIFKAFVIGCFQAISILPGVSRLGICITSARFLQIDRKRSIAFSMLLAIPTICASTVLGVIDCYKHDNFSVFSLDALIGIVVTMVIGLIIIFPCVRYMEKNGFAYLVIYRILIGLLMILL